MIEHLPYRPGVGAVLFNPAGQVLIARRADAALSDGAWQFPQGGIDPGEDPRQAVRRELLEEIGTDQLELLAEHPEWLCYDFPSEWQGRVFGGRYRGQRQRWFALQFLGGDADIRLDTHTHPEFSAWRWCDLADAPRLTIAFRRPVYDALVTLFAPYAAPS